MKKILAPQSADAVRAENMVALILSIIAPGLGQIYKGYLGIGLAWLFIGMPIALWSGILLSLATGGVGLLIPLACWAAVAVQAYCEPDHRAHHWFMGDGVDEDYSASMD